MADTRHRMVVEEIGGEEEKVSSTPPAEALSEVKEKVEELQDVTEDLSEDVQKTEDIQQDIAEAVENVEKPEPEPERLHNSHDHSPDEIQEQFPPLSKPSGTNPLVIIIPGIFLLGALLGGIYFYQKGINLPPGASPEPTPTEVANAGAVPSASPVASVDLTKYPVNVLNGSGTTGEAAKVKTLLEGGGFKVSAIGNASSSNFTKTIIKVKSDVPAAFVSQLSALLSKTYTLDSNQTLSTSASDSVQVIVGSSKAK